MPPCWAHEDTPAAGVQESNVRAASSVPVQLEFVAELVQPRMTVVVPTTLESTKTPPIVLVLWMLTAMWIVWFGVPTLSPACGGEWEI